LNSSKIFSALELSAAAYRDVQPNLPGTKLKVIDSKGAGVMCFLRKSGGILHISFRGTDSSRDWLTSLSFWKKTIPYGNALSPIRVHSGFINAYKTPQIRNSIHEWVSDDVYRVRLCGHSYGAALAVLCAVDIEYNFPDREVEVITFGCPRVGNAAFVRSYDNRVFNTVRVENGDDIVTRLPPRILGYRHVGALFHIGNDGERHGKKSILGLSLEDHSLLSYYESALKRLL
jgi:triacylglycerol lipase